MAEVTGYILDFSEVAAQLPPGSGSDYLPHDHRYLKDVQTKTSIRLEAERRRASIASPVTIASFAASQERPPSHDALVIKNAGSYQIILPGNDTFAVSVADIVALDLLKLYGSEAFKKAKLLLESKNSIVPTGEAQMAGFKHWHDHVEKTRFPVDMLYLYHTSLPTEIKLGDKIITPSENVIYRLGGEIKHRSKVNEGPPIARHWGAILVEREDRFTYRALPSNSAMDAAFEYEELIHRFKEAAQKTLNQPHRSRPFEKPVPLCVQPEELHV